MLWFKKNSPINAAPPVSVQFDQCCYTLVLSQIADEHTNAEALWQKNFTAYPKICEKNSQNAHYRLQAALDKNPAQIHCYNEQLKRSRPQAFVYADVLVWLPQTVVDKELRQNTGALNSLSTNLPVLHQDRFKTQLLNKRPPHYALLASPLLQADEVAFQFGFGIYVAATEERATAEIEAIYIDAQGTQHPFQPPISYHVDKMVASQQIYPEQDNLLIIKPSEHLCASAPAALWFSDVCSHVQLQRRKGQWQAFASSTSAGSIKIDTQQRGNDWHFEFSDSTLLSENGQIPRMLLIIKALNQPHVAFTPPILTEQPAPPPHVAAEIPVNHAPPPVQISATPAWGATVIPGLNQAQSYRTIIPGGDNAPLLIVESLALPRIDNAQGRVNGLKQWTIWFDPAGNIVDGDDRRDRQQCAALTANHQQAIAYFKAVGQNFAPLRWDKPLILGNYSATVVPSPLNERFHALIQLVNPMQFALQPQRTYTLGRKSSDAIPEIDLTLLNDPLGMEWEASSPYAGSVLSMLSLSRNHLSFSLVQNQLRLTVPANKQPVYVLNADLSLKETLHSSQAQSESVLVAQQCLLVGSFLLRFKSA